MSDPLGPVTIGAREIYDQVTRIGTAVERLADGIAGVEDDVKDHENRIRSLERGRWPLPALSALLAVAAVVIAAIPLLSH